MFFRKVMFASLLIAFPVLCDSQGQRADHLESQQDACSYYEPRVAFLLGCCGDIEIGYAGPRFPHFTNRNERATAALKETRIALIQCKSHESFSYLSLLFDQVGAELESSKTLLEVSILQTLPTRQAARHADEAAKQLLMLTSHYPQVVARVWPWLTQSFVRAGRPFEALSFLASLHPVSADEGKLRKIRGDVFFSLKAYSKAAEDYSYWASNPQKDTCDDGISSSHIAYLNSVGFKIPTVTTYKPAEAPVCILEDEWRPYVRLSVENMQ